MLKQETRTEFEPLFDPTDITNEIAMTRMLVEERFSEKIRIISALIEVQTKLIGIYYKQIFIKNHFRAEYKDNTVLNNTLLNFPYRALSTLLLTRSTFYGSARIVCRQLFESAIIAKYIEYDPVLISKWKSQGDGNA